MSEKVKLPKEVATAIEGILTMWGKRAVLQFSNYKHTTHEEAKIIKNYFGLPADEEYGFEKLVRALYIGYEVETTPEQQLLNFYDNLEEDKDWVVERVLEIIGMKVKGINS